MIDWIKSAELNNCTVEWLKARFEKFPKSNKKVWRICEGEGCNDEREVYFYAYHPLCKKCKMKTEDTKKKVSEAMKKYNKDNPNAGKEHGKRMIQWHIDHPKELAKMSARSIKQWSDQDNRNEMSEIIKQYHIDNPEAGAANSARQIQYAIDNPKHVEANRLRGIEQFSTQKARDEAAEKSTEYWSIQANRDAQSNRITNSDAHKEATKKQSGGEDIIEHHYIYDHANPEKYTMKVTRSKHNQIHGWMRKAGIKVPHINEDAGEWRYKK